MRATVATYRRIGSGGGGGEFGNGGHGEDGTEHFTGGGGGGQQEDGADGPEDFGGTGGADGGGDGGDQVGDGSDGSDSGGGGGGGLWNGDFGGIGGEGGVGGGGGGGEIAGGDGGDFGGGGGGGGKGGFGGGGGGGGGEGGFGGGDGSALGSPGDGGAALGGAVFVRDGGSLTISADVFTGSYSVTGGAAGTGGANDATGGEAQGTMMFLHGSGTTTFALAEAQTVAIDENDAIAGDGILEKAGAGTLSIGGSNLNFVGTASVVAGLLQVDGSIANATVSVIAGGTLGGNGTVGVVNVEAGGAINAGASAGVLATGDLALKSRGFFQVEIGGPDPGVGGYDQIVVTGTVDLGEATLDASLIDGFEPAFGDSFIIIANDEVDAVVGTFNGLAEGALVRIDGFDFTITYQGGDGNDVALTLPSTPLVAGVTIVGTKGADVIDATHTPSGQPLPTDGDDTIKGNKGADTISALAGDDTVKGNKGRDTLLGNAGDDTLVGGRGRDRLFGDEGNDLLKGGKGRDAFVFDTELGNADTHAGIDTIIGFKHGTDTILLAGAIFAAIGGKLNKGEFHIGGAAQDGNDFIVYQKSTGALSYDGDGSGAGAAIQFATLAGSPKLNHHDFEVL